MDNNIKWAQFISGGFGPPPTTASGRKMLELREPIGKAYAGFGKDITNLNSHIAKNLSGGDPKWELPIQSALTVIETALPMGGQFIAGANAMNHYQNDDRTGLIMDGIGTKPGKRLAVRSAILSLMMAHKATRPLAKPFAKIMKK